MYSVEKNTVRWENKLIYESPGVIKKHFSHHGNMILHYKVHNDDKVKFSTEEIAQNILLLDSKGNIVWRLEVPEKSTLPFQPNYQNLRKDKEGSFWAYEGANDCRFDPNTGKILERVFTK